MPPPGRLGRSGSCPLVATGRNVWGPAPAPARSPPCRPSKSSPLLRATKTAPATAPAAKAPKACAPPAPGARVAVVGAGPVGLWTAVLLSRASAKLFKTQQGFRIRRAEQAPSIDVYERREGGAGGWNSRRVVLAISNASQDLLNSKLLEGRELAAHHCRTLRSMELFGRPRSCSNESMFIHLYVS